MQNFQILFTSWSYKISAFLHPWKNHAQHGSSDSTPGILTLNLPAVHPSRDMNYLTWITLKDKSLSTELLGSTKRRWRWCWRPDKSRHTCGVSGKNYKKSSRGFVYNIFQKAVTQFWFNPQSFPEDSNQKVVFFKNIEIVNLEQRRWR